MNDTPPNTLPLEIDGPGFAERIRSRDDRAIEMVVKAYLDQVLRTVMGAGIDPDLAEDVTQSTFVTFIEKASSFDGRSKVRTWLFGILYRKIMEARRQVQKNARHDDIDDVIEEKFDSDGRWRRPPEPIDEVDMQDHIDDCLETVPLRQQLTFVLREVEGFEMGEICEIMQMSRSNLGVSLHRGRNQLRDCLEAKGIRGNA